MDVEYSYPTPNGFMDLSMLLPIFLIGLVLAIICIVSLWKLYSKAGKPGWSAIIPIYNTIVLLEIVGKPIWWILLFLIPFFNIVIAVIVYIKLAKCFGKGVGFAIGMMLLSFIFIPILAFGSSKYLGPDVE